MSPDGSREGRCGSGGIFSPALNSERADVARRVWAPKMNIEPQLVRVPCRLKTEAGLALLANSITLTPGTVTIAIEGDELVVHSLSDAATVAVQGPGMQDRIAAMERAS